MADVKISALPNAGTIVPGSNVIPLVSAGITAQANISAITTAALNATVVTVAQGGTGGANAAVARTNLGLGTIATQNSNDVSITDGNIDIAPLDIVNAPLTRDELSENDNIIIFNSDADVNQKATLRQLLEWIRANL